jgi:hypothetical protein
MNTRKPTDEAAALVRSYFTLSGEEMRAALRT